MRIVDHMLAILGAAGIDDVSAAWFVDAAFLYVNAACLETSIYAEAGEREELVDHIRERFERVDAAAFPHISALTGALFSGEGDERFRFGLRLMIDGLSARASAR
jgi:hypothetical protein